MLSDARSTMRLRVRKFHIPFGSINGSCKIVFPVEKVSASNSASAGSLAKLAEIEVFEAGLPRRARAITVVRNFSLNFVLTISASQRILSLQPP